MHIKYIGKIQVLTWASFLVCIPHITLTALAKVWIKTMMASPKALSMFVPLTKWYCTKTCISWSPSSHVSTFFGLHLTHIQLGTCRCRSRYCLHKCAGNRVPGHMDQNLKRCPHVTDISWHQSRRAWTFGASVWPLFLLLLLFNVVTCSISLSVSTSLPGHSGWAQQLNNKSNV